MSTSASSSAFLSFVLLLELLEVHLFVFDEADLLLLELDDVEFDDDDAEDLESFCLSSYL